MDLKHASIDLKDIDTVAGVVKAYANVYNQKDADEDISAPGSFTKSVSENFKRIKVLKDHDKRITLGVPLEIDTTDNYGLLTTTQFNLKKSVSKDMFTDIQLAHDNGLNSELSIGFKVAERDTKNKAIIKQYKLWEYSFLSSWGANMFSTVVGVKAAKSMQQIVELIEKSYDLDYSDERLVQIETILKSLTSGPSGDTLVAEPIQTIDAYINSLKTNQ